MNSIWDAFLVGGAAVLGAASSLRILGVCSSSDPDGPSLGASIAGLRETIAASAA